jgi:hypothetical protein
VRRFQNPAELLKAIPTVTGAMDVRRRNTRQSLHKTLPTASRVGTRRCRPIQDDKTVPTCRLPLPLQRGESSRCRRSFPSYPSSRPDPFRQPQAAGKAAPPLDKSIPHAKSQDARQTRAHSCRATERPTLTNPRRPRTRRLASTRVEGCLARVSAKPGALKRLAALADLFDPPNAIVESFSIAGFDVFQ